MTINSLWLAGLSSQLIAQADAATEAVRIKPTHLARLHTFHHIKVTRTSGSLVIARPTHFANPHVFNAIDVEQTAPVTRRYWRVRATQNNGDSFTTLGSRLEMFAGFDRINLSTASASAAGSSAGVFGNVVANAFDDDVTTKWAVTETGNDWLSYDFGTTVQINGIRLQCPPTQAAVMARDFDVQSSPDNSTWTTEWSVTAQSWSDYEAKFFWRPGYAPSYSGSPLTAARHWQVQCWSHSADTFSCAELIMATAPAGSQQASGGTAVASNANFGAAANAFDGNNATFWAPTSVAGQTIGYDFGSGVTKKLAELRWKSRNVGSPGQNPVRASIRFSFDGSLWHPFMETYTGVAWTDNEERSFTDPLYI